MSYRFLRCEFEDGVTTLTLNRPKVLNSFNIPMAEELQEALQNAATDGKVRALLLTGEGKGFCAGQDLSEVLPEKGEPAPDLGYFVKRSYSPTILLLRSIEKPVVCAVNGIAAGAGANIAFACDLVLASDKASFAQSFCKIGLVPDSGGTFFLPRLVGLPRATAMMMLGEKVGAQEAFQLGLIYKVCPDDQLQAEARTLALHLATQPTAGLGYIKQALNHSFSHNLEEQLDLEAMLQGMAGRTYDYGEGVSAFMEKRKPQFRGN